MTHGIKILRYNDLRGRGVVGSRMTLWRWRKDDPNFPRPVQIGGGIGWYESEIDEWLRRRPRVVASTTDVPPDREAV
jgi:predicted DNA-binding transcriptional regulator AlpA